MINIGNNPIAHFLASFPKAGEICIAFATFFTVLSVELSRKYLCEVPIGIYSIFRMIAGSVIFFFIVIIMLGWVHFIDIFNTFLLEWMSFYGGVIIAFGLFIWYRALRETNASDLSVVNSFQPIAGIFFAYLILSEIPEFGQIVGGVIIMIGVVIGMVTKIREKREDKFKGRPRSFSGV